MNTGEERDTRNGMGSGEDKRVELFPVVKRSNVTRGGQGGDDETGRGEEI